MRFVRGCVLLRSLGLAVDSGQGSFLAPLREGLGAIRRRCAALPVLDTRTADEILGYDERGLPA
jgi:Rv0623-like transcription factor